MQSRDASLVREAGSVRSPKTFALDNSRETSRCCVSEVERRERETHLGLWECCSSRAFP